MPNIILSLLLLIIKGEDINYEKLKDGVKLGFALKEKSDLELFNFMLDQNEIFNFSVLEILFIQ